MGPAMLRLGFGLGLHRLYAQCRVGVDPPHDRMWR
jgi:hypothetical protein